MCGKVEAVITSDECNKQRVHLSIPFLNRAQRNCKKLNSKKPTYTFVVHRYPPPPTLLITTGILVREALVRSSNMDAQYYS